MMKPYSITIASQKGGVGKTSIAVNLAIALTMKGSEVLLIDADTTNPVCGFHLGMEKSNSGYYDVIKKHIDLKKIISIHSPSGLHVINGKINEKPFEIMLNEAKNFSEELSKMSFDFIIIDTQPGYYNPQIVTLTDEILFITTPDLPSCISTIKLAEEIRNMKIKNNLLINRIQNKRFELHEKEIANIYNSKILKKFPEDPIVPIGIAEQIPAIMLNRNARFSREIWDLASSYIMNFSRKEEKKDYGLLNFILKIFRRI